MCDNLKALKEYDALNGGGVISIDRVPLRLTIGHILS